MSGPQRFRKKPVVIEAMQWDGSAESGRALVAWSDGYVGYWHERETGQRYLSIETLEGRMRAEPRDWIIRGLAGEFYPCKPDIFAATYEPAIETSGHLDKGFLLRVQLDDEQMAELCEYAESVCRKAVERAEELYAENARMRKALDTVDSFLSHEYHRNGHRLTDKEWAADVLRQVEAITRRRLASGSVVVHVAG